MRLASLLTIWIGIALIGLFGWVVPWIGYGGQDGPLIRAATAIRDEPSRAGFAAVPAIYATHAWVVIGAVAAACGLFAMFSGRRDRWFATIGYLLCAAALGVGAFGTYGDSSGRSSAETLVFYGALAAAAIMLLMTILSIRGAAFLGAIPAVLAALVGLGWSIWFVATAPGTGPVSVAALGWTLPVAHLLVLVGALLSVAIAGRNKSAAFSSARYDRSGAPGSSY